MEASVVEREGFDGTAEATRNTEELFQWSAHVHVGAGALECEHREDGKCEDWHHFHAWVCLPNTYQVRDVVDKARAAKARKTRALRDPESDAHVTLEADLDELRSGDGYQQLMDALSRRAVEKRWPELVAKLRDDDRFEFHEQDMEEMRRLEALPEDDRPTEEYERLQAQAVAYAEQLQATVDEEHAAELEALKRKPVDDVIELERQARIEDLSWEAYNHAFYTWAIYIGTRRPRAGGYPTVRRFKTPEDQRDAPPEALVALREKIRELERRTVQRSEASGN